MENSSVEYHQNSGGFCFYFPPVVNHSCGNDCIGAIFMEAFVVIDRYESISSNIIL